MNTIMNDSNINSLEQIKCFLEGVKDIEFDIKSIDDKYKWIQKRTGYSRQQLCRLVFKYKKKGFIKRNPLNKHKFPKKYSENDIKLLIKTDNLDRRLSGPATKKILEREYIIYKNEEYSNIALISPSHIYNLRESKNYRKNVWIRKY